MGKTKVLQFPIANSNGGITHYALGNWKWMDKELFQCDFVTMSKHLDFEDEILATGSRIFYLSSYAEENREQFIQEFDAILKEGYDVVHLHTKQWKSFLVEEICRKHHVPKIIVHSHNTGIDTTDPVKRAEEMRLHERIKQEFTQDLATDFWACSKLAAEFLFGKQIPKNKIRIMPNAIELDKFRYNQDIRNEYRKKYGLEDSFVIGHVGRFVYQKNHEFLVNVFKEVSKNIVNAKLVLIGDGELMPDVRHQVRNLRLDEKVFFMGKTNDVNHWYQAIDVFCLPSRFEGLPIVLIEAQGAGLPCIACQNISDEVEISSNIIRLSLEQYRWVRQILIYYSGERKDNEMQLRKAGYDIQNQIRIIEKFYRGG